MTVLDFHTSANSNGSTCDYKFPKKVRGAFGGLLNADQAVICGGLSMSGMSNSCHALGANQTWYLPEDLADSSWGARSVIFNGRFLLVGGRRKNADYVKTATWISLNQNGSVQTTNAGELPITLAGHTMEVVKETAIIAGGYSGTLGWGSAAAANNCHKHSR